MGLVTEKTHWIFLLPSTEEECQPRHLLDIAFGLFALQKAGIDINNISVIVDSSTENRTRSILSAFTGVKYTNPLYTSSDLSNIIAKGEYENVVMYITGHGSPYGLDSNPPIKPYPFFKMFYNASHIKNAIIYFGQCYAGIFDKMPLEKHLNFKDSDCNIIAIGSTGFYPSVSYNLKLGTITLSWSANIFLFFALSFLLEKEDVDGDNKISIMDSFKYASYKTNECLVELKKQDEKKELLYKESAEKAIEKLKNENIVGSSKENLLLDIEAYETMLKVKFTHQEPWILNSSFAMEVEI